MRCIGALNELELMFVCILLNFIHLLVQDFFNARSKLTVSVVDSNATIVVLVAKVLNNGLSAGEGLRTQI